MRMILLSALFALGVGIAGSAPATAAPIGVVGPGLSTQLIQDVQYYRRRPRCRSVRVCNRNFRGRLRCHYERVCRRW